MALTKPKPTALELDFRTRQGRRFAELCAELERRFAPKAPSLADLLRIKSAAALIVRLEQMQATAASGGKFNPVALSALSETTAGAIAAAAPPDPNGLSFYSSN